MSTPVRVTAQIVGKTAFNTKAATLEWTPDGRIRIMQVEPGEQPVVLLDTPPAGLKKVSSFTVRQAMMIFEPQHGSSLNLSLIGSMIAPEPQESADSYARRTATTGVPPQQWWVDTLMANGVKVVDWGMRKTLPIALGVVGGVLVLAAILATLEAF